MSKRMTLYFHNYVVYKGLLTTIGKGNISRSIENLVRPLVVKSNQSLENGYKMMAQDKQHEKKKQKNGSKDVLGMLTMNYY